MDDPAHQMHQIAPKVPRCAPRGAGKVPIPRRHAASPTFKASGPLTEPAAIALGLMAQEEVRRILLQRDPYITSEAVAALRPPAAHDGDADPAPAAPPQLERYPARMFPAERHAGLAATLLPAPIRRIEYCSLNLYGGRRRLISDDVQACVGWSYYLTDFAIVVLPVGIAIDPVLGNVSRRCGLDTWNA